MFEKLVRLIQSEVDSRRTVKDIDELYSRDRWFNYPKFQQSARYSKKRLVQLGARGASVLQFPADGETLCGSWRTGLAWDARKATLTVLEPQSLAGTVLADYQAVPCSLVMWSGPTPKGGLGAEVVDVGAGNRLSDYSGKDVRGKIVLVSLRASAAKGLAAKFGAVGVLTDWNPHRKQLQDAVFWNNAFSDNPSGWPATATCSRLFGFGVSPRLGQRLRQVLAEGKKLRVHALVDTRLYAGRFPVATGSIPGTTRQEVLALGHAFEQGAKDNASGIACILEALRVIAALIRGGKLPRPRRGIRALVTNECFGTIGYVDRFPQRTRDTVAGLCLDEVGVDQKSAPEVQSLCVNPCSNASYLDAFSEQLARGVWQAPYFNPWVMRPYASTDNLIAHSSIGIPTVWIGCQGPRLTWHTSIDTPDRASPEQLAAVAVYTAAYLYFIANAGPREAVWLAGLAAAAGRNQMQQEQLAVMAQLLAAPAGRKASIVDTFVGRLNYLAIVHSKAVRGVLRLSGASPVKKAVAVHLGDLTRHAAGLLAAVAVSRRSKRLGASLSRRMVSPFGTQMPPVAYKVRPMPAVSGPITYDPIAPKEREGHEDPRWDGPVNVALGWADGQRTLAEVVALAEHETGRPLQGLAQELLWLIPHGLVRDAAKR